MRNHAVTTQPIGLGPSDHVAWAFDGPCDLDRAAVPYLAEGLRAGQRVVYVIDEPPAMERLAGLGDVERLLAEGSLALTRLDDACGADQVVWPEAQQALLDEALADARARGRAGVRAVSDVSSMVEDGGKRLDAWLRWEQLADRPMIRAPFVGMCAVDRRRVSPWIVEERGVGPPHRVGRPGASTVPPLRRGGGAELVGAVDGMSVVQFRRLLATLPPRSPRVVDVAGAQMVAHGALLALAESARGGELVLRNARPIVRELWTLLELDHCRVRFEPPR